MIVVSATASIFLWGLPYLESLNNEQTVRNVEFQFNSIIDNIRDLVGGKTDGKNNFPVSANDGEIRITGSEFDRTIVCYSYTDTDFTISGLDEYESSEFDSEFGININVPSLVASAKFFDDPKDPGNYTWEDLSVSGSTPTYTASATAPRVFSGRVCIFLNSSATVNFGKIWLFDSNPIKFALNSNQGLYELILEKGGIIYSENGDLEVKRPFSIFYDNDYFRINVLQMLALTNFSAGANGFSTTISVASNGTWVQEQDRIVYHLRLQLYGDNAQTWLDYIYNKYQNEFTQSGDTLHLDASADGVYFSFLNSIIKLDI